MNKRSKSKLRQDNIYFLGAYQTSSIYLLKFQIFHFFFSYNFFITTKTLNNTISFIWFIRCRIKTSCVKWKYLIPV